MISPKQRGKSFEMVNSSKNCRGKNIFRLKGLNTPQMGKPFKALAITFLVAFHMKSSSIEDSEVSRG